MPLLAPLPATLVLLWPAPRAVSSTERVYVLEGNTRLYQRVYMSNCYRDAPWCTVGWLQLGPTPSLAVPDLHLIPVPHIQPYPSPLPRGWCPSLSLSPGKCLGLSPWLGWQDRPGCQTLPWPAPVGTPHRICQGAPTPASCVPCAGCCFFKLQPALGIRWLYHLNCSLRSPPGELFESQALSSDVRGDVHRLASKQAWGAPRAAHSEPVERPATHLASILNKPRAA